MLVEALHLDLEDLKQTQKKSTQGKKERQSPTPFIKSLLEASARAESDFLAF